MRPFLQRHRQISRNIMVAGGVLCFAVIGTILLVSSKAATPTASYELEAGTRSGNATLVSDANASGGSAVRFNTAGTVPAQCASGGAYLWANLETCGWPGPTNTGPDLSQCPGGLTAYTGSNRITTANTVINCKTVTGGLNIAAQNVTIKNSKVSFNGNGAGGSGVININDGASATIDHVETNGMNRTHSTSHLFFVSSSYQQVRPKADKTNGKS